MSPRFRRLILTALFLAPLLITPALASAQSDDQPVSNTAKPSANLFHSASPFLLSSVANADESMASPRAGKSEGFGIGVKIGPIFSSLSGGNISYSNRTGLEGGIWFGGNRGGRVGVMGEILYAKKGASQNGTAADVYYLEIPILMRINIGSESKNGLSVYFLGGEVNDIKLKAKLDGVDVSKQFAGLDEGILIGGGVEVARFLIELRETFGLRNVFTADGVGTGGSTKNRSFAILVGFRFN